MDSKQLLNQLELFFKFCYEDFFFFLRVSHLQKFCSIPMSFGLLGKKNTFLENNSYIMKTRCMYQVK